MNATRATSGGSVARNENVRMSQARSNWPLTLEIQSLLNGPALVLNFLLKKSNRVD